MKQGLIKIFLGFFAVVLFGNEVSAQGWCGTKLTPEYVQFVRNQSLALQNQRVIIPKIHKTLNVTAWITLDRNGVPSHDENDVIDAIAGLNQFLPMGLNFTVCKVNYIENWQFDDWVDSNHLGAATVLYYQPNTINMYLVDTILDPQGAGGYAPLPPSNDYMVIKGLEAIPHEMGHYLGLFHTFETDFGTEFVDGSNCTVAGDLVCDTEADPGGDEDNVDITCNYIPPQRDPNGDFYEPPTDNIMSYYGECPCRFTTEQFLRMVQQLTLHRGNLW